jgi:hypothetical protein
MYGCTGLWLATARSERSLTHTRYSTLQGKAASASCCSRAVNDQADDASACVRGWGRSDIVTCFSPTRFEAVRSEVREGASRRDVFA